MQRLIDADALKQMIDFRMWDVDDDYPHDEASNRISEDHAVKKIIDEMPTIDAEPVRHGKWIPNEDEDGEHYGDKCSECGEWYVMPYGKTNFCPNCGADMRGEK